MWRGTRAVGGEEMSPRDREQDDVSEVRDAYDRLMAAFARADTDRYFDCFDAAASFVFPGEPLLDSRAEYREAWQRWEREGLRFTDVRADDVRVRVLGSTAIVTHRIETTMTMNEEESVDRERESIVFSKIGGRWLAVHEHLSADETQEVVP